MKKRMVMGVLCLLIVAFSVGCGNKKTADITTDSSNVEVSEENDENIADTEYEDENENADNQSELDKLEERKQELAGYTIITPYVQIILASDGKVLAKGQNRYGQLGNGERTDTETWSEVEGLEDIVGIYSLGDIGNEPLDEYGHGHCYALSSSGELYRWGGNILIPEEVTVFPQIKEVRSLTSESLFIRCESGEQYIISPRFSLRDDDSIYSYNSLPEDAEICGYGFADAYLIYSDETLSYINVSGLHQYGQTDSFEEILPIEDEIKDTITVNISEKIENITPCFYKGLSGATLVTDSGSVLGLQYTEGKVNVDDWGGSNIKKASLNHTDFLLSKTGRLSARGDNDDGQLGDGTMIDYDDGFLDIGENLFLDFEYNSKEKYCVALDDEYNVWGWGKGFGVSPSIVVENNDFIANDN